LSQLHKLFKKRRKLDSDLHVVEELIDFLLKLRDKYPDSSDFIKRQLRMYFYQKQVKLVSLENTEQKIKNIMSEMQDES